MAKVVLLLSLALRYKDRLKLHILYHYERLLQDLTKFSLQVQNS